MKGRVVRFGKGTPEHESWNHGDWTLCDFGKRPDLATSMRQHDAVETENGDFVLPLSKAADAIEAATGSRPQYEDDHETATVGIVDNGITVDIPANGRNTPPRHFRALKGKFRQFVECEVTHDRIQTEALSELVYCAKQRGEQFGWFVNIDGLEKKPKDDCRSALLSINPSKPVVAAAINHAAANTKEIAKIPFKDELYEGKLNWNAPQLWIQASPGKVTPEDFPTWMMLLTHLGKYLDPYLKKDEWAKRNGILTGVMFLIAWIATAIRDPISRTSLLSFVGPQESGKSFLERALSILTTVIKVDGLLRSGDKFDAELEGMPFVVCDEPDLAEQSIFDRIKPWITDAVIWVRAMYRARYPITNYTHWLQFTNKLSHIPVFDDTTRITVIRVDHIPRKDQIETKVLEQRLRDEAPAFVNHLFSITLPSENGRASIPAIETEAKAAARNLTDSSVNTFVDEMTTEGDEVSLAEFTTAFNDWNGSNETQKNVKAVLQDKGVVIKKRNGYDHVHGLKLIEE